MDVLSRLLSKGHDHGAIEGFRVGRENVVVSHVQFADDNILFLSDDVDKFKNVLTFLVYLVVTGLIWGLLF